MKYIIALVMVVALGLSVAACGGGGDTPSDGETAPTAGAGPPATAEPDGDREPSAGVSVGLLSLATMIDEQMDGLKAQMDELNDMVEDLEGEDFLDADWLSACCEDNIRSVEAVLVELVGTVSEYRAIYDTVEFPKGTAFVDGMDEELANLSAMLNELPEARDPES